MEDYAKRAEALFRKGYNCAQAVTAAFWGEDPALLRLASPFGGGMGRLRQVCGAVSGMFLVLSRVYGYDDPAADEEKKQLYAMEQELARRFTERFGTILCGKLLDNWDTRPVPDKRTAQYYEDRPCPGLVYGAGDILSDFLQEHGVLDKVR